MKRNNHALTARFLWRIVYKICGANGTYRDVDSLACIEIDDAALSMSQTEIVVASGRAAETGVLRP